MKITIARRISQIFFVLLFFWLCLVMTLGEQWWELRGWPVNLFLNLDPLTGIATLLSTGTLYSGLLWGLVTVVLTILLGRFFCGWICPFGTLHQAIGYLAHRKKNPGQKAKRNRPSRWQNFKYLILLFFLGATLAGGLFSHRPTVEGGLLTGLLDPIALMHRSLNLFLLPLADGFSAGTRFYAGTGAIGLVFVIALGMNLWIPRFYCRFVCPLGALLGLLSRFCLYRIGKAWDECTHCMLCESDCEGACAPAGTIRVHECVLCMNCLHGCFHDLIRYQPWPSASGQQVGPDISRRELVLSLAGGALLIPGLRLGGGLGPNWDPKQIRPPGALPEAAFLSRCIQCGQCMRICPTNVIHPAGILAGLEGVWTPVLNFRVGTSGCQFNCIACGQVCPTAAIRPLSLAERQGKGEFEKRGPVRIGMAFVDQGRCLPWAMDRPCIVCQENCPVSPKAIKTQVHFAEFARRPVRRAPAKSLELGGEPLPSDALGTGDYFARFREQRRRILANTAHTLTLQSAWDRPPAPGDGVAIVIKLQRPVVDPGQCIGCGVCEHECPIQGKPAIRVTAENQSREPAHGILL